MPTKSIENVGRPSEVENQFGWPCVRHPLSLQRNTQNINWRTQIISNNNTYYITCVSNHCYLICFNFMLMLRLLNIESFYLAMGKGSYGHIPCSVSGHHEAQEWPDSVVVERRDEDRCCTACPKDVSPSSLVQIVVYVVYVTETILLYI